MAGICLALLLPSETRKEVVFYIRNKGHEQRRIVSRFGVDLDFLREDGEEAFSSAWIWGPKSSAEAARANLEARFGPMKPYPPFGWSSIPDEMKTYLRRRGPIDVVRFERSIPAAKLRSKLLEMGVDMTAGAFAIRCCPRFLEVESPQRGEKRVRLVDSEEAPPKKHRERSSSPEAEADVFLKKLAPPPPLSAMPPTRMFGVEISPQILL